MLFITDHPKKTIVAIQRYCTIQKKLNSSGNFSILRKTRKTNRETDITNTSFFSKRPNPQTTGIPTSKAPKNQLTSNILPKKKSLII